MKHTTTSLLLTFALLVFTGCANPFKKAVAAADVTVEHAMDAWGEHVKEQRAKTPPNLLLSERQEVKRIYERYQTELDAARRAYNAAVAAGQDNPEATLAAALSIQAELLDAIRRIAPNLLPAQPFNPANP